MTAAAADIPLDPDAETARRWLSEELSKPAYTEAKPSWFDQLVSDIWDWLSGLLSGGTGSPPGLIAVVIVALVIAALVAAWFIFGAPRLNRRSASVGALFGTDDTRGAAALRTSAEAAASVDDWALAIEEMFRAVARGTAERAILTTTPGTTAHGFAAQAQTFFPEQGAALTSAAAAFDDVRYLGAPGSETAYRELAQLESALRASTPRFDDTDRRMSVTPA